MYEIYITDICSCIFSEHSCINPCMYLHSYIIYDLADVVMVYKTLKILINLHKSVNLYKSINLQIPRFTNLVDNFS